jgi:hypothetical protein
VALVGQQLFAIGGDIETGGLHAFEMATVTELPSVSAGGPYSVTVGGSVQVSATGSEPEGQPLAFAWDLDGDLVYETPGQTATFSAVGAVGGARTIRVRALDPQGAYRVAEATLTVTGATRVAFATQPGGAQAGALLTPQPVVQAVDDNGAVVPGYTGPVRLAFGTNAGGGVLGGTATVNAVNGVATFTDLFVTVPAAGYTLTASSVGLTPATSAPFTITAPPGPPVPTFCDPRPKVIVSAVQTGPGVLTATIAAQTSTGTPSNALSSIRITKIVNAAVTVNGAPLTEGAAIPLPNLPGATLAVQRQAAGQPSHVAFTVVDVCGEWPSFVGGGPGAF